jgi:hypothetical protein
MRLLEGQSLKVIVYEHVSGGGYAGQSIPSSVLCEGFGMLRSIVADLKLAGHEVTVFLDTRISQLIPQIDADFTVPIFMPRNLKNFQKLSRKSTTPSTLLPPKQEELCNHLLNSLKKRAKQILIANLKQ